MKAIYHIKAGQLLIDTEKYHTNGIMAFRYIKTKFFDTQEKAEKYAKRYYKNHTFEASILY